MACQPDLDYQQVSRRARFYTTEVYQQSRDDISKRQAQELLELSTPVVQLWDKILALPPIGTLDSERTQTMMENLGASLPGRPGWRGR